MPSFETEVIAEVDVEIDEFYSSCSKDEKEELAELIIEDGLASALLISDSGKHRSMGIQHENYMKSIENLSAEYFSLSQEDIEKVIELSKKYS